jgi:CDP-paratose 2-epimerase
LELFDILEDLTGVKLNYKQLPPRESDQRIFIADIGKAVSKLQWQPRVSSRQGVSKMLEWLSK